MTKLTLAVFIAGNRPAWNPDYTGPYCGEFYAAPDVKPLLAELEGYRAAADRQPASKELIRDVFLRKGFTIKEGCDDLKDYVFDAAFELLAVARQPMPADSGGSACAPGGGNVGGTHSV